MSSIITTVGSAIELCKKAAEAALKIRDAKLKNLIGDLALHLADLKIELASIQEENLRLRKEVDARNQNDDFRSKLTLRDGAYFLSEPPPGRPDGPYCTRCFDVDGTLVLLHELSAVFEDIGKYRCGNCKAKSG